MDYKIGTSSSRFSKGFNYIYNKKAFDGQMQPKLLEPQFSNPLLVIQQFKTNKITTVKEVWIPFLISTDFDDFTSLFTPQSFF